MSSPSQRLSRLVVISVFFQTLGGLQAHAARRIKVTPKAPMSPSYYVEASPSGFAPTAVNGASFRPDCFKSKGVDLLIIDPGHDDSDASRRSDAMVRGQGTKTQFLWPKIHEGNLTQVVSWLTYDMILKDPRMTPAEKTEMQTMIRFSRHPGETQFGQYERELGYNSSTQGAIDDTVTNRKDRINFMMQNHRSYNPTGSKPWLSNPKNVSDRTAFVSVHANSSDYFNEGDLTWVIPPKQTSKTSPTFNLVTQIACGLSSSFTAFLEPRTSDTAEIRELRRGSIDSVRLDQIKTGEHSVNLAMLSTGLGTAKTRKTLVEGFVMNGKIGNLANKDISGASPKSLTFKHGGKTVASYAVAEVYVAYAQSLVLGLSRAYGCSK